jgi:hypothetical protein
MKWRLHLTNTWLRKFLPTCDHHDRMASANSDSAGYGFRPTVAVLIGEFPNAGR